VQEILVPKYIEVAPAAPAKPRLFADMSKDDLLGYGVPAEWLDDVRNANEDTLLELADHLPSEAAEALLNLAKGGTPEVAKPAAVGADPFAHPDAQRRFRVMNNQEELERALDYPWDKWTIFLHPAQRALVERDYRGASGGFGGYGENHRGATSGSLPGTSESRRQGVAYDFFRHAGECAQDEPSAAHQQRTAAGGTAGGSFDERDWAAVIWSELRPAADRIP
jgi:hypothetical protein